MISQIKIIEDFFEASAPEFAGRSASTVNAELQGRLESMASGNLGEDEARSLCHEILANEAALETLASLLKNDSG